MGCVMKCVQVVSFGLLALVVAAHAEKKVYKCANADGSSVFSPDPCGAGAQELKIDASASPSPLPVSAPPPSPVGTQPPSSAPAPPTIVTVSSAEDAKCRQDAERLKTNPAQANLDMLLQRQAELVRSYSANASDAVKVQIGNLDATIEAEQARLTEASQNGDRAYARAIAKCEADVAVRNSKAGNP